MDDQSILKLPFIFVPDGAPLPFEWLRRHPDAIRLRYWMRRAPFVLAPTKLGDATE